MMNKLLICTISSIALGTGSRCQKVSILAFSGNGQTALLLAESRLLFVLIALHVGQQTACSPLYILEVIAKLTVPSQGLIPLPLLLFCFLLLFLAYLHSVPFQHV